MIIKFYFISIHIEFYYIFILLFYLILFNNIFLMNEVIRLLKY